MGRYSVELTEEFDTHLNHWMKVGNKAILRKLKRYYLNWKNILPQAQVNLKH